MRLVYPRNLKSRVLAALADFPVVLINGARQTGKTTLVRGLEAGLRYETLDDVGLLAAARNDPLGFIRQFKEPVIIDEVQRAPEIFLPLKQAIDNQQRPGMFILTGSANVLTLARTSSAGPSPRNFPCRRRRRWREPNCCIASSRAVTRGRSPPRRRRTARSGFKVMLRSYSNAMCGICRGFKA
jgi:AAA domain